MTLNIKNICCIGAGYVGGPTMAVIASKCPHIKITVVDISQKRIEGWNNADLSKLPIYEPGLKEIIKKYRNKNLFFSSDIKKGISEADMIFIAVNTPTKQKGIGAGQASDLKWIEASARQISKYAKGKTIVVEKSTLPVKTAETIQSILDSCNDDTNLKSENKVFTVLSNPEFLAEGSAIKDLEDPDRVLIGGNHQKSIKALKDIYLNWVDENKILTTNLWSSELSKLTANAFLAQRISSINSISALCESTGANINEVSNAIGLDQRIGSKFLNAGPGFGGSCFKKDILNLVYICSYYGLREIGDYWQKVIDLNIWQTKRISNLVIDKLFGNVSGKKIAIFGFAFKANTNDTRESPSIEVCKNLLEEEAYLKIYDPKVKKEKIILELGSSDENKKYENGKQGTWEFCDSILKAVQNVDAIIILTEWDEFKDINWELLATKMRKPSWVFDTRSICNLSYAKSCNINTWCVGQG